MSDANPVNRLLVDLYGADLDDGVPNRILLFLDQPAAIQASLFEFHDGSLNADDVKRGLANKSEFARLVNQIPRSPERWDTDGRQLWTELESILSRAIVASDPLPESDRIALNRARSVLYDFELDPATGESTLKGESAKLRAYNQLKAAYRDARRAHARAASAPRGATTDDDVASRRADMNDALDRWKSAGFKSEIERAFATTSQFERTCPRLVWASWQDQLRHAKMMDLHENAFYETRFSPSDFPAKGHWQKIELVDGGHTLRAETAQVSVIRRWFDSRLFTEGYWTWPDDYTLTGESERHKPVSTGDGSEDDLPDLEPEPGTVPGYPIGLVVGRNIVVDGQRHGKDDQLMILAYICRGNPVCPRPNRTYTWEQLTRPDRIRFFVRKIQQGVRDHEITRSELLDRAKEQFDLYKLSDVMPWADLLKSINAWLDDQDQNKKQEDEVRRRLRGG